jgi:hypothetical protein
MEKTTLLTVRLDADTAKTVKATCYQHGHKMGWWVAQAIKEKLAREAQPCDK